MISRARTAPQKGRARRNSKVPEKITGYFWTTKLLTTAMGEATSDFLVHHMNPYAAVVLGFIVFAAALAWQISRRSYHAIPYWTAVTMVAIFGTMAADATHVAVGVPYYASSTVFAVALAAVFIVWSRVEHTLSIHSIHTLRRELFYWAAIVSAFALGTAVGDTTATTLHLGYLGAGILFAVLFALSGVAWTMGANEIFAFWAAYVLTRPLGASFADWFGMPRNIGGGLGYGHGPVSIVLTMCIIIAVSYTAISRLDVRARPDAS